MTPRPVARFRRVWRAGVCIGGLTWENSFDLTPGIVGWVRGVNPAASTTGPYRRQSQMSVTGGTKIMVHKHGAARRVKFERPANGPVTSIRPNPLVWDVARDIAETPYLLVLSPTVVVVCNSTHHRKLMREVYAS